MRSEVRLLMVSTFLAEVGTPGVCDELAARLRSSGWIVSTTSSATNRVTRLVDMLATVVRTRRQYDVAQVDVYSGPAFVWAEAVTVALQRLDKPMVLTLHGGGLPAFGQRWPERVRRVLERASQVTVPSRYLQETMGRHRKDLRLVPNPVDLPLFSGPERARPRPKMIWVRSFHSTYDPLGAVRVLAGVAHDCPDATLTMIGPDKGDGSLAGVVRLAERLGVRERLTLPGRCSRKDVAAALACHDIFLNTTGVDNTPLSIIEALASGVAVVSTAVGGLPYLLRDERDALLVPFGDVRAMVAAVGRIVDDPSLARRLTDAGRRTAAAFDWGRVLPQWQHLLTDVATRRGKNGNAAARLSLQT